MKQCPTCQSQYTDDTLQFCLQDGAPLQYVANSQMKTADYGEQETVFSNRPSSRINPPRETQPTNWIPKEFQPSMNSAPSANKSNTPIAFVLTGFVLVLFLSLLGVGAWLYLSGAKPDGNGNILLTKKEEPPTTMSNRSSTAPMNPSKPTPAATRQSETSAANTTTTAPVDNEQLKKDVTQRIDAWKSAAESHNLDSYMNNYANTVDYYTKKGASIVTVRSDKQRAFAMYDSLQSTLTNMTVTPDAAGDRATVVFDKEWNFSGAEKSSSGKVKQQMELRKIDGQWLITSERDLKLYYKQ